MLQDTNKHYQTVEHPHRPQWTKENTCYDLWQTRCFLIITLKVHYSTNTWLSHSSSFKFCKYSHVTILYWQRKIRCSTYYFADIVTWNVFLTLIPLTCAKSVVIYFILHFGITISERGHYWSHFYSHWQRQVIPPSM